MSFKTFCNICFMKQNIIKLCEEENEHIFNILINFTPSPDILNGIIYLCTICCNKLEEYDKFKQLFLTNFVRFRYLYNEHRKNLEMRNEPDIEMQLKSFVDVNVERPSCTPLIENYEHLIDVAQASRNSILTCKEPDSEIFGIQKNSLMCEDTSFKLENNATENETHNRNINYENDSFNENQKSIPGSTIVRKCELDFCDEDYNEFTTKENVKSLNNESCNSRCEDKYFEAADIKLEKGEPSFCEEDYKELMQPSFRDEDHKEFIQPDNDATTIPCHSPMYDESCNFPNENMVFETDDNKLGKEPSDEANKAKKIRDICKVCHKGFRSKNYLEIHMRIHTGDRQFACNDCEKTFVNNSKLIEHKRVHSGEKPYTCDECDNRFRTSSALKTHKRIHSGEKPYSCDECNKTFIHRTNLTTHKRIHSGEKPYKCEECDMKFIKLDRLNIHKRIHTGERPYYCDECNKTFADKSSFNRHKRVHSGEKRHICGECGLSFLELYSLKIHERKHTGERPFVCDVCNKTFTQRQNLIIHKRYHTGEKPYKCDECGMGFTQSSYIKRHKRKHTGEKPYFCDKCHKDFSDISSLNKHKHIHNEEKPFKCDECGLGFRQHSNLTRHKRIHTDKKP